jgi:hypothetical protein
MTSSLTNLNEIGRKTQGRRRARFRCIQIRSVSEDKGHTKMSPGAIGPLQAPIPRTIIVGHRPASLSTQDHTQETQQRGCPWLKDARILDLSGQAANANRRSTIDG